MGRLLLKLLKLYKLWDNNKLYTTYPQLIHSINTGYTRRVQYSGGFLIRFLRLIFNQDGYGHLRNGACDNYTAIPLCFFPVSSGMNCMFVFTNFDKKTYETRKKHSKPNKNLT